MRYLIQNTRTVRAACVFSSKFLMLVKNFEGLIVYNTSCLVNGCNLALNYQMKPICILMALAHEVERVVH